jgi:two-component system OmpR family response regulator
MSGMKILIIEDDKDVAAYIQDGMQGAGHDITVKNDGLSGLEAARSGQYDILIVDRMLPGKEGLSVISDLRAEGYAGPVLILSAMGEVDDRVKGLRSGGDDYLVKPFSFDELLARVEVLAARVLRSQGDGETVLTCGDLVMDLISREVRRGEEVIDLKTREFALLEYMLRNKGQIVTRTMLLENVWHYNFDPQTNVIDVHVSRLRSKVDKDYDRKLIQTVRGSGYIISEDYNE